MAFPPLSVSVPRTLTFFFFIVSNVTVPVSVPVAGATGVTSASSPTATTFFPLRTGCGTRTIWLLALPTDSDTEVEVAVPRLVLPLYDAVTELEPRASARRLQRRRPELSTVAVPRVLPPAEKVTVPVGVPPEAVTVAMNETACP